MPHCGAGPNATHARTTLPPPSARITTPTRPTAAPSRTPLTPAPRSRRPRRRSPRPHAPPRHRAGRHQAAPTTRATHAHPPTRAARAERAIVDEIRAKIAARAAPLTMRSEPPGERRPPSRAARAAQRSERPKTPKRGTEP
jgi:hypothetical protein